MGNQIIDTTTIINYGTTGNFIDPELIALAKLPLQQLKRSVKAYNVDSTTNSKGNIVWETNIDVLFPQCKENIQPMVLNLGCVTISFLFHVFFLLSVVRRPYFSFAPSYQETDLYLLAFPDYSSPLLFPL